MDMEMSMDIIEMAVTWAVRCRQMRSTSAM